MEKLNKNKKSSYHTPQEYALSMVMVGVAAATLGGITRTFTKSHVVSSVVYGIGTFVGYSYIPDGALRTATLIGGGTLTGMKLSQALWESIKK